MHIYLENFEFFCCFTIEVPCAFWGLNLVCSLMEDLVLWRWYLNTSDMIKLKRWVSNEKFVLCSSQNFTVDMQNFIQLCKILHSQISEFLNKQYFNENLQNQEANFQTTETLTKIQTLMKFVNSHVTTHTSLLLLSIKTNWHLFEWLLLSIQENWHPFKWLLLSVKKNSIESTLSLHRHRHHHRHCHCHHHYCKIQPTSSMETV